MNPVFDQCRLTVFERGWLSSNNVLFDGDSESAPVLIDSGHCRHASQTVALVRAALASRTLARVVNTHLHSDHCGGNAALQDAFSCAVDVPAGEVAKVDAWDEAALTFVATGQRCPRFVRSGAVAAGEVLQLGGRAWEAVAAPGHDPESVMLYQPDHRVLISADALWEDGFGVIFPELDGQNAFETARQTLDSIASLKAEWVIPGHGAPFSNAAAALERAFRRLDGFVAKPRRHALHAVKVLIKFHLLDVQSILEADLLRWMAQTPYFELIWQKYFDAEHQGAWLRRLITELVERHALRFDGLSIHNA